MISLLGRLSRFILFLFLVILFVVLYLPRLLYLFLLLLFLILLVALRPILLYSSSSCYEHCISWRFCLSLSLKQSLSINPALIPGFFLTFHASQLKRHPSQSSSYMASWIVNMQDQNVRLTVL